MFDVLFLKTQYFYSIRVPSFFPMYYSRSSLQSPSLFITSLQPLPPLIDAFILPSLFLSFCLSVCLSIHNGHREAGQGDRNLQHSPSLSIRSRGRTSRHRSAHTFPFPTQPSSSCIIYSLSYTFFHTIFISLYICICICIYLCM